MEPFPSYADIYVKKPDEKAVMTYVSFLHNAFPHMPPLRRKKVHVHVHACIHTVDICNHTLYIQVYLRTCTCAACIIWSVVGLSHA